MTGTSQGNSHPEYSSTINIFASSGVSSEVSASDPALPRPFTDGEWETIVASAVAAVAESEAAEAANLAALAEEDARAEAEIASILEAQPLGARALSLPIAAGASTRIPTWHSRAYWLSLCEWLVTHTERGRAALRRRGISAGSFVRGCAAHAAVAESATGRRVTACLDTLIDRSGLSIDQIKRCRRVLRDLELGVEQARGKKLNGIEREAAARLHAQVHGTAPARQQRGAASVWALSAPLWAVETMPAPARSTQPVPNRRRTAARPSSQPTTSGLRSSRRSAPQSPSGSFSGVLSARKDHQRAQAHAGEKINTNKDPRDLDLQKAAAELVHRIPSLGAAIGVEDASGRARGHIGVVCDALVKAGIDTTRWTGLDIVQALNADGMRRGWTWPTAESMKSPIGFLTWRIAQLDWTGLSPTERIVVGRQVHGETPAATARRLVKRRRAAVAAAESAQARPASAEHRQAMRAQIAAALSARKASAA
ncbi:hypothetical protein [Prescottella equi]|uniref:hypothetical protein n=1 Tax=Rhodococcus hoagii TaxID=43767 RepID=UPI00384FBA9C